MVRSNEVTSDSETPGRDGLPAVEMYGNEVTA